MNLVKRILIVTTDVKFGLSAKKGLEHNGEYQVTVFSSGHSAVDYVRQNVQDLVIMDFRIRDMPGTDIIDHMRAMQPNLAVIATPDHPAVQELKLRYNIQEIINIPIRLRQLVVVIENALKVFHDEQPDTALTPPVNTTDTARMAQSPVLEFWLADVDGNTIVERTPPENEPETPIDASATFQRLAAEEPPMPSFEEGSTIRDLREKLSSAEQIQRVLEEDDTEPNPEPEQTDSHTIPAALILETALDDSTPIRSFSLQEFISQVTERGLPEIEPLPSWLQESERYIREPDFLADEMQELTGTVEYTASVTMPGGLTEIEEDPGNMVTDPIEPVQRSKPPTTVPEVKPSVEKDVSEAEEIKEDKPEPVKASAPISVPELKPVAQSEAEGLPFTEYDHSDPQLAQLATTLTQVALELTADATVLARNGKIAAYAGKLPPSDIEELHEQLTKKWDTENDTDKSRILFATVASSGAEYMISTRSTDFGFTLSLIFSGTRPLQDIRRQSKRLVEALESIPEPEPEPEIIEVLEPSEPNIAIPSTDEIGVRLPITFLWLLRDPDATIPSAVQQEIIKTLDVELTQVGWKIADIHAPSYLYIQGDMPTSFKAREILDELMNRVSVIIHDKYPNLATENLWHDSYMILQPGREMRQEEIQRFISFARR